MKLWTLILFLVVGEAFAQNCKYQLSVESVVVQVTEDQQVIPRQAVVNRAGANTSSCENYFIYFNKGASRSYQRKAYSLFGHSLHYNLHRNSNLAGILKEREDATSASEYLNGRANSKHQNYTQNFYVSLPGLRAQGAVPAGFYFDMLEVRVHSSGNNRPHEETKLLYVTFYISQDIRISLVEEGGTFDPSSTGRTMDFGLLAKNQEKGVDLKVLSNSSYKVRLSSQNNGRLLKGGQHPVNYALKVNGSPVSLTSSAGAPVQIGSGSRTPQAGDTYNLKVRITTDTENHPPGEYSDVITITAVAN